MTFTGNWDNCHLYVSGDTSITAGATIHVDKKVRIERSVIGKEVTISGGSVSLCDICGKVEISGGSVSHLNIRGTAVEISRGTIGDSWMPRNCQHLHPPTHGYQDKSSKHFSDKHFSDKRNSRLL